MTGRFRCLLSTVESDSHFWNLIYLEKVLEEQGAAVRNLGSCTPPALVVEELTAYRADLLVVSSINGHGYWGARELLTRIRRSGSDVPCVVGGRLTTAVSDDDRVRRDLLALGYTDVFVGPDALGRFREFLDFGSRLGFARWRSDAPLVAPWDTPSDDVNVVAGR